MEIGFFTFLYIVIGIGTVTSWLFKLVDWIEHS